MRWDDLGSWIQINGCSSRAAAAAPTAPRSRCAQHCAGHLRVPGRSTMDGLVTMHSCTCWDSSAIATGRTSEDSVTRHRMIRRRHVCYVKTLASGRVPSDANERACTLTCIHDEYIIDGRIGGALSLGRCPYVACGCCRLGAAGIARQHARGPARSPAVAQFTA